MGTRKTNPNHKASFSYGVHVNCSCGWASTNFFGKGARREAAGEWQRHREYCELVVGLGETDPRYPQTLTGAAS